MSVPHPLPPLVQAPTPNQSSRHGTPITGVVVHETEGGYAGAVSWLRNPAAQASAHVVLREDGLQAAQLVPWGGKAWHAVNANPSTIGLEIAGYTASPNQAEQIARAARIVAWWCQRYHISPRQGSIRGGLVYGVVRHRDLGAFGGGHFDPGGFAWDGPGGFLAQVQAEVQRGQFRARWGV